MLDIKKEKNVENSKSWVIGGLFRGSLYSWNWILKPSLTLTLHKLLVVITVVATQRLLGRIDTQVFTIHG